MRGAVLDDQKCSASGYELPVELVQMEEANVDA